MVTSSMLSSNLNQRPSLLKKSSLILKVSQYRVIFMRSILWSIISVSYLSTLYMRLWAKSSYTKSNSCLTCPQNKMLSSMGLTLLEAI